MKGFIAGIGIGAAASATGVAGYLGFQQLVQPDQSKPVGKFQPEEPEFTQAAPRSTVQRVAAAALISQPERIEAVSFEALSYCEQMDVIAKSSKSVSAFIAASADRSGYLWAVKSNCNWHRSQAAQVSKPETSEVPFQALSYCDQLDALDRSGKSVSGFIVDTADPNGYVWAARNRCNWHSEQANAANLILNPPVGESAVPVRRIQEVSYPSALPSNFRRVATRRQVEIQPFVQEPAPSYSAPPTQP